MIVALPGLFSNLFLTSIMFFGLLVRAATPGAKDVLFGQWFPPHFFTYTRFGVVEQSSLTS